MKKILTIVPVLAIAFAFSTSLALASSRHDRGSMTMNYAKTSTTVGADASTGFNVINQTSKPTFFHAPVCSTCNSATINTGNATSQAGAMTAANTNIGSTEGFTTNNARTRTTVSSYAETGGNVINSSGGAAAINTGNASSSAKSVVMVNSNVSFGGRH